MQPDLSFVHLQALRAARVVNLTPDPDGDRLFIANYAARVQYDNLWDQYPAALHCRGLVIDRDSIIHGRGFKKFFGLGQRPGLTMEYLATLGTPHITTKLDGSMVLLFYDADRHRWRAVTRGSFNSPQAQAAQAYWSALPYRADVEDGMPRFNSFIFEWTAPDNRIVVAYTKPALTLIGMIDNTDGHEYAYLHLYEWARFMGVPLVDKQQFAADWHQQVQAPVANFEGYVLHWPEHGLRVKVKLAEYVTLHRLFTGLNRRTVWEAWSGFTPQYGDHPGKFIFQGEAAGVTRLKEIQDTIPDELFGWFTDQLYALRTRAHDLRDAVSYDTLLLTQKYGPHDAEDREQRKLVAQHVQANLKPPVQGWVLSHYRGQDWETHTVGGLFKYLEPSAVEVMENPVARREEV